MDVNKMGINKKRLERVKLKGPATGKHGGDLRSESALPIRYA